MEQNVVIQGSVFDLPFLSAGASSWVFKVSESIVIKAPHGLDEDRQSLAIEHDIYRRLGVNPSIPKLPAVHKGMLVLERLQTPLRDRLLKLHQAGCPPSPGQSLQWASQITQGLQYIHQCGVLQVDIGLHNVLLDSNDNTKICDFAGSSIDGSPPNICPSHRAEHPSLPAENPSLVSEHFALGSLLYELETGQQPYHEKDEEEIERLFEQDHFPNTDNLMLGNAIMKCWKRGYTDDEQIIVDLGLIRECLEHDVNMGHG
ncbi:hypothetical protein PV05_03175 [Exophiala xenobiotica]|uniref:Protein kinase domain-containing protein n=1 Tax=Exophiala xenobiotica TaxID=348802 RepID=A0A0D2C1N7_9EURO|nr:uncharacterized protein PV05_03175 [Exophiala xenobiotica]KIW58676.1 hypothetical protein PV05_03175 [Exophiala xenobiotica]